MIPILAAPAGLVGAESQALEHGALLLVGPVVDGASAEAVAEVLVVPVSRVGGLRAHDALGACGRVDPQGAGLVGDEARGAAVAGEVPLLEDLDQLVLPVALHGTRVADPRGVEGIVGVGGRWVAG